MSGTRLSPAPRDGARFDYIVLGAGSAGCVLAARLSEDPTCRVLLVEAGGPDDAMHFRVPGLVAAIFQVPQIKERCDWGYVTEPQRGLDGRVLRYARGKVLGGCSSVNGMLYVRGDARDYDDWGRDNPGWSWADLLPLMRRSERNARGASETHGGDGPIGVSLPKHVGHVSRAFIEATARRCGVRVVDDLNTGDPEGAGVIEQTVRDGERQSTSRAFLRAASQRPNLTVVAHCLATRLRFDGRRAVGVEVSTGRDIRKLYAESEVISCLGAIGSPGLLQRSGIGPAAHLRDFGIRVRAGLPVGDNLHDHFYVPMRFLAPRAEHLGSASHFGFALARELIGGGTWIGESLIHGCAFVKTRADLERTDLQIHTTPWAYPEPNDDVPGIRPDSRRSFTMLPTLIRPESRGTVRLRSVDPRAAPRIDPAFLTTEGDAQTILRGMRLCREIAATQPLAAECPEEATPGAHRKTDAELLAEVRLRAHTVYHPVGTCKMAPGEDGVVDSALRVKGIDGLRVADAGIIPTIPGGNTNAASIAIGEKCADLVRGA